MSGSTAGGPGRRFDPAVRRVLIISENESVPGDRRVWDISTTLSRSGCEVVVVCPMDDHDQAAFETRDGVEIHRYRPAFAAGGALGYAREYARAMWCTWRLVRRLTRARRFDLVHSCTPPDFLVFAARPARRRGARVIFDHHDLTPELVTARFGDRHRVLHRLSFVLERLSLRFADVAIATNQTYAEIDVQRGGKRPENVFVVPNAPDLSRLRLVPPDPALKRGRPLLIGYLGVMGDQDGVDGALQALAQLRERRRDWHAIFAGDGSALPELRRMADGLGLGDVVEFPGWVGDQEIARLLSTADVCLSPEPKTAFNDASTMVKVIEYMAMSRPIVAFPLRQTQIIARDAAAYAAAGDVGSFAARIDDLLDDSERRSVMGALGRARVEDSMSWEHSTVALAAAYRRAVGADTAPRGGTTSSAAQAVRA